MLYVKRTIYLSDMKMNILQTTRRGFTLIELMVVIVILAALGSVGYTVILQQKDAGEIEKTRQNLTSIGQAMEDFKTEYKSYPCDRTAETIMDKAQGVDFGALTGDFSNCYLRQLLHGSSGVEEKTFYAYANLPGVSSLEGDNRIANGRGLEKGETGFAYVMLKEDPKDPTKKAGVGKNYPLVVAPLYPTDAPYEGDKVVFDITSYKGKVFVYRAQTGSVDTVKNLIEDENEEGRATPGPDSVFFPENKRGKSFPERYIILPPEL